MPKKPEYPPQKTRDFSPLIRLAERAGITGSGLGPDWLARHRLGGLVILEEPNGRSGPVILCDACGEMISYSAGDDCAVCWEPQDKRGDTRHVPFFAHKGPDYRRDCMAAVRVVLRGSDSGSWHDLDVVLTWLRENCGITGRQEKDAKERADRLAS